MITINDIYKTLMFFARVALIYIQIVSVWEITHSWWMIGVMLIAKSIIVNIMIKRYFKKIGYEPPEGIDVFDRLNEVKSKVEELRPQLMYFNLVLAIGLWLVANKDVIFN